MGRELKTDQEVLDFINGLSNSFCGAKWYNATIWLGSGMTTSCHHPPAHKIDLTGLQDNPKLLHNTVPKKEQRRQMQCGERPAGCEYCWKIEDMGKNRISDRVYKSKIYSTEELTDAFNLEADRDVDLRTLEISFDRTCNFACSYCNPAFSTSWVKDIKQNGPYQNLISDGRNHFTHTHDASQLYKVGETNPYVEAFFKWWETDLHKTLHELRVTGGEPLMSADFWRLVDWFKTNEANKNMRFAVNTNLGAKPDLINQLIQATYDIGRFHVYTSCEATHSAAEYIRDGLNWTNFKDNINHLLGAGHLEGFHMMCTINALCLSTLPDFLDELMHTKYTYGKDFPTFSLNILRFPSFQSPLVLPLEYREDCVNRLKDFVEKWTRHPVSLLHEMEIHQIERLVDYLLDVETPHSGAFELPKLRKDFKNFYTQYDKRRGKNFTTTFPELRDWYNSL